jgi:hypothetical protein
MDDDPFNQRKERGFDAITLLLGGALAAIVIGAVGYGIVKSYDVADVPGLTAPQRLGRTASPPAAQRIPDTQAQDTQATIRAGDGRR